VIESEIRFLKDSIDKLVEIKTTASERLIARVLFVTHSEEYDEHDLLYEMVSTNTPEAYGMPGDYVLDFDKIVSVTPYVDPGTHS